MWYIYSKEYYTAIKKNNLESFVETWMDLETVKQSDISQGEKNKYHLLAYICGIQKNDVDDFICETEIENKCMETKRGKEGWDELGDWDRHRYTTDTMHKIDN